jgi:hypothetical protein
VSRELKYAAASDVQQGVSRKRALHQAVEDVSIGERDRRQNIIFGSPAAAVRHASDSVVDWTLAFSALLQKPPPHRVSRFSTHTVLVAVNAPSRCECIFWSQNHATATGSRCIIGGMSWSMRALLHLVLSSTEYSFGLLPDKKIGEYSMRSTHLLNLSHVIHLESLQLAVAQLIRN